VKDMDKRLFKSQAIPQIYTCGVKNREDGYIMIPVFDLNLLIKHLAIPDN
jgi:hypothetical protein